MAKSPDKDGEPKQISETAQVLFANNRKWAAQMKEEEPDFFSSLAKQQTPKYLWIGCSDSRVPANVLMGIKPGGVFVHRNISNICNHSDLSMLSVLQYAVEVLRVEDILVVGHLGCGGIRAAMGHQQLGLIDNWLRHIRDVYYRHFDTIEDGKKTQEEKEDELCILNIRQSFLNVCSTSIVQAAWARGQKLRVHGWVYSIHDGLLREIDPGVASQEELHEAYQVGPPRTLNLRKASTANLGSQ